MQFLKVTHKPLSPARIWLLQRPAESLRYLRAPNVLMRWGESFSRIPFWPLASTEFLIIYIYLNKTLLATLPLTVLIILTFHFSVTGWLHVWVLCNSTVFLSSGSDIPAEGNVTMCTSSLLGSWPWPHWSASVSKLSHLRAPRSVQMCFHCFVLIMKILTNISLWSWVQEIYKDIKPCFAEQFKKKKNSGSVTLLNDLWRSWGPRFSQPQWKEQTS